MNWVDVMPVPSLVGLLNTTFFPKWMRVLCSWLSANPNYDEVTNWYMGWKSMFPEKLLREPAIAGQ
jgi:tuftelin-interacting protein 11